MGLLSLSLLLLPLQALLLQQALNLLQFPVFLQQLLLLVSFEGGFLSLPLLHVLLDVAGSPDLTQPPFLQLLVECILLSQSNLILQGSYLHCLLCFYLCQPLPQHGCLLFRWEGHIYWHVGLVVGG